MTRKVTLVHARTVYTYTHRMGPFVFVHLHVKQTNEQTNSESLRSIWLLLLDGEPGGQIWKQASHLDFKTHVPKNTPPSLGTFSVEPFLDAKK